MSNPTSNRKTVPTFEGRVYTPDGNYSGNWVRRAEVDALFDEIERLRMALTAIRGLSRDTRSMPLAAIHEITVKTLSGDSSAPDPRTVGAPGHQVDCAINSGKPHCDCGGLTPETPPELRMFDPGHHVAQFDAAWASIIADTHLDRAKRMLSAHELRTLIAHVGKAFVEHEPYQSVVETGKDCVHNLVASVSTLTVIDPHKAKCRVCYEFFDLPLADSSGKASEQPPCTCHPDDNPPQPCPKKYALSECRKAAEQYRTYPGEPVAGIYEAGVGIVRLGKDDELGPNHD